MTRIAEAVVDTRLSLGWGLVGTCAGGGEGGCEGEGCRRMYAQYTNCFQRPCERGTRVHACMLICTYMNELVLVFVRVCERMHACMQWLLACTNVRDTPEPPTILPCESRSTCSLKFFFKNNPLCCAIASSGWPGLHRGRWKQNRFLRT